jgi:sterol desaturase/sphingolipid hydroxylase (fatty acid hydroxylase superfamily)
MFPAFLAMIGVGLLLLAAFIAIEYILPIRERYTLRQRIPGVLMGIATVPVAMALMWPVQLMWKDLGLGPWIIVPLWDWLKPWGLAGAIAFYFVIGVMSDFFAYWRHRAEHTKWLWPIHVVHHAPTELHAANNIGHPAQALFNLPFITLPFSLIQFPNPGSPAIVGLIFAGLVLYVHSPIDLHFGRLNRVVVDNRFHRIHHSLEPEHIGKNFGICFSCWDYLFGTAYTPKKDDWPAVGVAGISAPYSVGDFLALPLREYRKIIRRRPPRGEGLAPFKLLRSVDR